MLGMTGPPENLMKGALLVYSHRPKSGCEQFNNHGLSVKPNYLEALLA